jgi:hypothetical protein
MNALQKRRFAYVQSLSTKEFNSLCDRVRAGFGTFDQLIDIAMGVTS